MGSRSAALLSSSISPDVAGLSNLQSSEVVLHRHLALCKGDFGCESSADCTWNQLSNNFSASLILHCLLTKDILHLSTLFADRFAICACYRRKGHFQQTEVCTAVSSFSSSICMEVLTIAGADGTDPSARAAAFALRQAPTILPLWLDRLNSLDLCSCPQNSAQLLGYVYLDGGMSLLWRGGMPSHPPAQMAMRTAVPHPGWYTTPFAHPVCSTPQESLLWEGGMATLASGLTYTLSALLWEMWDPGRSMHSPGVFLIQETSLYNKILPSDVECTCTRAVQLGKITLRNYF